MMVSLSKGYTDFNKWSYCNSYVWWVI